MDLKLYLQVYLLRFFHQIMIWIDRFPVSPKPMSPTFTVTIPSKLSKRPGNFTLYFYLPRERTRTSLANSKKDLPLIVNFYPGAFIIGHAADDSRWATTLLENVEAVFVSVGYRRGPECPQPTAVED